MRGGVMSDLEMTRLSCEAMGYAADPVHQNSYGILTCSDHPFVWNPLGKDEQAMELVKRFKLCVSWFQDGDADVWHYGDEATEAMGSLNRAIVECVAKMQASVSPPDNAEAKST